MPEVSVIIPTHNRAARLPGTLASVLAQTFADFEVLVVDDASEDETPEVVRGIGDPRVRLIRLTANGGAAAARNAGIAEVRGGWVAFLDSDDRWLPDKLERQLNALRGARDPANTLCAHAHTIRDGGPARNWPRRGPQPEEDLGEYLFAANGNLQTSSWMLSRGLCAQFPFAVSLRRHEDWDVLLRLGAAGVPVLWLPEALSLFECRESPDRLSDVIDAEYSADFLATRRELFTARAAAAFEARVVARQFYRGGRRASALRRLLCPSSLRALGGVGWAKCILSVVCPRAHSALVSVAKKNASSTCAPHR